MPVVRGPEPTENFTVLSNDFLRDERLSYRARGILAEILTHTADWCPDAWEMSLRGKEGRDAIYAGFAELEACGYLVREKRRTPEGRWVTRTTFHATPVSGPIPAGRTDSGFPGIGKPGVGGPGVGQPGVGNPGAVLKTGTKNGTKEPPNPLAADGVGDAPTPSSGTLDRVEERREDVERLCLRLAEAIEANGSKRPPINKGWRDAARLMLDRDGRTEAQITAAIDWSQGDEFWRCNILSMPTLRKQYEKLRLSAQRQRGNPVNGKSTTDERVRQGLELAAKFRERRLAQEARINAKEIER